MSAGYAQEDQALGPVSLALVPLLPWLRVADRQAMPQTTSSFGNHQIQQRGNFSVAMMPSLLDLGQTNDDLTALELHLGSELSGCDPKFILSSPGSNTSKYLFKPSHVQHKVWNELLAYHINTIAGFDRVPTVMPYEIPFEQVTRSIKKLQSVSMAFKKCNFHLDAMDEWIHRSDEGNTLNSTYLIGTLQLMVPAVSKRSKTVQRARTKIGKWSDQAPSLFAQREIGTRSLFDFVIGNYDRYNNDFIQTNPENGDRILVYIDQGTYGKAAFAGMYRVTEHCRFYYKPVDKLRRTQQQQSLQAAVLQELELNDVTRVWNDQHLINVQTHPTVIYMNERVDKALEMVDECVTKHGHDFVFLQM
jgi:hypothetical protein